jgi:hypothetical protein
MNKSFIESKGTALSTDWTKIGKGASSSAFRAKLMNFQRRPKSSHLKACSRSTSSRPAVYIIITVVHLPVGQSEHRAIVDACL